MSSYSDPKIAKEYLDYANSTNGKIEQAYTFDLISKQLNQEYRDGNPKILDLGCGQGWLTKKLSEKYKNIIGCDISAPLIEAAKNHSNLNFQIADFSQPTSFNDAEFDAIVINMATHSIANQEFAFREIARILKPAGLVLITLPNPYYAYPVGVWKRGWTGFLFKRKPRLKLKAFWNFKKNSAFSWNRKFTSHFYPLSQQINNALKAGLRLEYIEDMHSQTDSTHFDTNYQLHRFPITLFLKYKK